MSDQQQTNNQSSSSQTDNQSTSQQGSNQSTSQQNSDPSSSTPKPELIPLVQELLVFERKEGNENILTESIRTNLTRQNDNSSNAEKK